MIIVWIWLIGAILLLSVALTVYEKMGNKMSDEAIWLYLLIATFWPIFLFGGLMYSNYHSHGAWKDYKKSYKL